MFADEASYLRIEFRVNFIKSLVQRFQRLNIASFVFMRTQLDVAFFVIKRRGVIKECQRIGIDADEARITQQLQSFLHVLPHHLHRRAEEHDVPTIKVPEYRHRAPSAAAGGE